MEQIENDDFDPNQGKGCALYSGLFILSLILLIVYSFIKYYFL